MFSLIAIRHVIARNSEWLLIILCRKFHNYILRETAFSRNKLLIWSNHHSFSETKLRLTRNRTNLILEMSSILMKNMTARALQWLVSSTSRMLFDNSSITKIIDLFWWVSRVIWRFWRNSWWNVYKNWRISKMFESLLNAWIIFIRRLLWFFRDSS
jgi:hypothetical protein